MVHKEITGGALTHDYYTHRRWFSRSSPGELWGCSVPLLARIRWEQRRSVGVESRQSWPFLKLESHSSSFTFLPGTRRVARPISQSNPILKLWIYCLAPRVEDICSPARSLELCSRWIYHAGFAVTAGSTWTESAFMLRLDANGTFKNDTNT